jgi:mannose-6-phosphate isomerase-like protein (cupin superfamily)
MKALLMRVLRYFGVATGPQPYGPVVRPVKEVLPRDWGEEIILVKNGYWTLKKIIMKPGTCGGLQYHHKKHEGGWVVYGSAKVEYDAGDGKLVSFMVGPEDTFYIPQGAVHRMTAGNSMHFCYIEASTPHLHDRMHVEKLYGLPEETGGLPSTKPEDVVTIPRHKPYLLQTDPQDSDFGC